MIPVTDESSTGNFPPGPAQAGTTAAQSAGEDLGEVGITEAQTTEVGTAETPGAQSYTGAVRNAPPENVVEENTAETPSIKKVP